MVSVISRCKKPRVHAGYKTKYRVTNWTEYDRALAERGSLTYWLSEDAIGKWEPAHEGRRGGQLRYSDVAIETALTLRLVFPSWLPLPSAGTFPRINRVMPPRDSRDGAHRAWVAQRLVLPECMIRADRVREHVARC